MISPSGAGPRPASATEPQAAEPSTSAPAPPSPQTNSPLQTTIAAPAPPTAFAVADPSNPTGSAHDPLPPSDNPSNKFPRGSHPDRAHTEKTHSRFRAAPARARYSSD